MIHGTALQGVISSLMLLSAVLKDHVSPAALQARLVAVEATSRIFDISSITLEDTKKDLRRSNFPLLDTLVDCRKIHDETARASFSFGNPNSTTIFWNLVHECINKERSRLFELRRFWLPNPYAYFGGANATSVVHNFIQKALCKWDQVLYNLKAHLGDKVTQQSVSSQAPSHSQERSYDIITQFQRDYAVAESTQLIVDAQLRTIAFLIRNLHVEPIRTPKN